MRAAGRVEDRQHDRRQLDLQDRPDHGTSRGVITSGDGAYTIKFTSKWEGGSPIPGMPAAGTSNMTIEAKRLSECTPEQ